MTHDFSYSRYKENQLEDTSPDNQQQRILDYFFLFVFSSLNGPYQQSIFFYICYLFRINNPKQLKTVISRAYKDRLKGHRDTIISVISPYGTKGQYLYSASRDGQIRAWDLVNREIASKLLISRYEESTTVNEDEDQPKQQTIKQNIITAATFSERSVYSGYEDGFICSKNIKSGEMLYTFIGHKQSITALHFLNVRQLVSASLDGTIRLWDTSTGICEIIFNIGFPINKMNVLPEKEIQLLYTKNTIVQLDPQRQNIIRSIQFPNIVIMSFCIHNKSLILGTLDNQIQIYDIEKLDQGNFTPTKQILGAQGWALCFAFLDQYVYVGTDDKKIKVFELKSWELKEVLLGHKDGVTCLAFANDMLYSGSYDHLIKSWNLEEIHRQIREQHLMSREDINSKRYDVYLKSLPKSKKRGGKK
ncbi:hypothetical protein pb186bvf_020451 [Paramecium bursaria]